jgi:hypothetical protein
MVAEKNRDFAERNLRKKLSVLELWVEKGVPLEVGGAGAEGATKAGEVFVFFPKSVRQFNAWNDGLNSSEVADLVDGIRTNANSTLLKYPALRDRLVAAIGALRKKTQTRRSGEERARDDKEYERAKRMAVEKILVDYRRQIKRLERKVVNLEKELNAVSREERQLIQKLTSENEVLRTQMHRLSQDRNGKGTALYVAK